MNGHSGVGEFVQDGSIKRYLCEDVGRAYRLHMLQFFPIAFQLRWARLLISVYRMLTKELPISVSVCSKYSELAVVRYFLFRIYIFIYRCVCVCINIYLYLYTCSRFKQKTEAQTIFLNPFTVCSSFKRKLAD
jgi:hypothetical protein